MAMRRSSSLASAGSLAFATVEVPPDIDLSRPIDPVTKPKVRLFTATDSMMVAMRPDGRPDRKTWDAEVALGSSKGLFRLKAVSLPSIKEKDTKDTEYRKDAVFEHLRRQLKLLPEEEPAAEAPPAAVADVAPAPRKKPRNRAEKYFDLLMKRYDQRCELWTRQEEEEARDQAEASARYFDRAARKPVAPSVRKAADPDSSSDDESQAAPEPEAAEEPPPGDCKLRPWDGVMRVEVEVLIAGAPGDGDDDEDRDPAEASSASSSAAFSRQGSRLSTESSLDATGRRRRRSRASGGTRGTGSDSESDPEGSGLGDLYDELERLKQEMGVEDDKKSQDSDDIPEGLKQKRLQNVWDNPRPKWSLGIGGTVFFLPDAERYAMGSSLPPPPPPSLYGRRRIKLKPRLPLEISNHRYRDEHPFIWPEGGAFKPKEEARGGCLRAADQNATRQADSERSEVQRQAQEAAAARARAAEAAADAAAEAEAAAAAAFTGV